MRFCFVLKKFNLLVFIFFTIGLCLQGAIASDLSKIRNQIQEQEQKIAEQKRQQDQLQSTLKTQEIQIKNVINQLSATESDLKETRRIISETEKQIKALEKREKQQKAKLSKQLDMMYRSGLNPSVLERLFSEDAQKAERMKAYYNHLNLVRLDLIKDIEKTQVQLLENKKEILQQQQQQKAQLDEQKKQQQDLQKIKTEHQITLKKLNRTLARDENKLESLKANENALLKKIQQAEQLAKDQEKREREAYTKKKQEEEKKNRQPYKPTAQEKQLMASTKGLGKPKRQYQYPVSGKILNSFGSTQMGELKWKGIFIKANAGSTVKAIADGRVILANFLQGYGLMVIIKHGDNDLSLYGFNQEISVKEGQYVHAGEKIAEVGSSGSQSSSGLYFEIRRKGMPMNPVSWIR
ncbi:septal ring factor EnvC (AmiA/AmiB activator) [Bisgaardia hudsonensis]|uniref:Septal ring factor EnvC (AmiA/AmiB activator) n=1 Tax=Bisgaardia hudsonensis TaxID=109472 RepID=A0A4R2MU67_9PAST|nr:murein hydrolase activator EnvC [Bisgaardia hudsonensis]TCP12212.1 septal ring factor EnvC (AmiA/AmiB activator) [Bisgaardia hudsonensis]